MSTIAQLTAEFEETIALVKELRSKHREEPVLKGQRGGPRPSPYYNMMREQQEHLVRLARLINQQGGNVPEPGAEGDDLLD